MTQDTSIQYPSLEAMAAALAVSPDYRVLTRFSALPELDRLPDGAACAAYLDTETTGKNVDDVLVELGLVLFAYDPASFDVLGTLETYSGFNDPGRPIDPAATRVNGITDDQVQGQALDLERINGLLSKAGLVIAHNADFDRPKVELLVPVLASMPWACSMSEVPWADAGFSTRKLEHLAMELGHFYSAHRAEGDCHAGIQVLNCALPELGNRKGLGFVVEHAKETTYRLWASGAPFHVKDTLKANGYRWCDGTQAGTLKSWYLDLASELDLEVAAAWLLNEVLKVKEARFPVSTFTARERFSSRPAERASVLFTA